MTETVTIERDQWAQFLEQFTREHEGDLMTVEVLDPALGDQVEGDHVPFAFATFDPRDDVVILSAGGTTEHNPVQLRHVVSHPSLVDLTVPEPTQTVLRVVSPTGTTLAHFYPKTAIPVS